MNITISRAEKLWLLAATIIVMVAISLPYLVGWLVATPERPFVGVLFAREDVFSYYAKMRLGASGEWLYHDVYAVQPHPAAMLFLPYLALGHIVAPFPDPRISMNSLALAFHAARILCAPLLLVTVYITVSLFLPAPFERRGAWLLIVLGGGLGWLMLLLTGQALPLGSPPLDFYLGEYGAVVALLTYPHVLLARAALLAGLLCLTRSDDHLDLRWSLAASVCWLIATMGVPFDILIGGGIVAGWAGFKWLRTRRFPGQLVASGLIAGIPGVTLNVVTLLVINGDPVYASWMAQNRLPLPHPLHLLSAFGIQGILAVVGGIIVWRERYPFGELLLGWAVVIPFLTLFPVPFQLRLIESFSIPLTILAVVGLVRIFHREAQWLAFAGLCLALLPSTLFLLVGSLASAMQGNGALAADQYRALDWLRLHAESDGVTLAPGDLGIIAPAAAPVRSLIGHGFETPGYAALRAQTDGFFSGLMPEVDRRAFLAQNRVRYVMVGPEIGSSSTVASGGVDSTVVSWADHLPLVLVFRRGDYQIYEVAR